MSRTEIDLPDGADRGDSHDQGGPGQALTRNVGVLMASQLVTWALSLVGAVVIPRYIGAELIGRLHIANSLWAIGFVLASFGMNLMLTKEVARDATRIGPLLGTSIAARLLLFGPVALALFVYGVLAGYPDQTLGLLAIIGLATVVLSLSASVSAVLQGLERMGPMAVASIIGRIVFVGGAIALLVAGYSVYAIAAVTVAGNLASLAWHVWALRRVRKELGDHSRLTFDASSIVAMLRQSAPYFGVGFFIALYLQVDAVVISLVVETEEVLGWYSVYDRLGGTLLFVPTVFMTAMYPVLSRRYADADTDHTKLTRKSFELMLLISIPIGFGLATVARPLVELLFGDEFSEAGPVVAVGGVVTSLTYLTTVLGMFLISMDRQREWTRFIALGAVLTIPLDFTLVPFFQTHFENGAIGGAVAYLVTESVILMGAIYLLPRGSLGPSSVFFTARVVLAGLVMVAAVYPLRNQLLLVPVAVGGVVYAAMVMALRLTTAEDRELVLARVPVLNNARRRT